MAILTSSQLTFVDITDQRKLSAYITSNLTTIQIRDTDSGTYTPDWGTTNLVLTPSIFLDQSAVDLSDQNLTVTWKRKEGNNTETSITTGESVSNKVLTVSANKLGSVSSDMLTYICYVTYADTELGTTANITSQLTYTLVRTASDAKTCSISGSQIFKYDTNGNLVGDSQITLTGSVKSVSISQWQYYDVTTSQYKPYPTTTDNANITSSVLNVKPEHAIFNSAGIAKIKLTTNDDDVFDVITISKLYDGLQGIPGNTGVDAYTIYLTNESHTFAGTTDAAISGNTTTQVYAYQGSTEKSVKITKVNNVTATTTQTNTGITGLQFKVSSTSATAHPTITFYALTTLTEQSGVIPITMTVDGMTFTKNFSWSVARTGAGASSVSITSSSQIFKSTDGQNYTPDTVTLTPIVQNLALENCSWSYSENGGSSYTNITSTSASTTAPYINSSTKVLTIPKNMSLFSATVTSVVFKCTNGSYYDTMTVSRLSDGKSAAAAYTVILSNEAQNIPTDTSLKPLSTTSYNCNVTVYKGTNQLVATTNTPSDGEFRIILPSNPTGMSLTQTTAGIVTFSVTQGTVISSSGSINLTIQIEGTTNTLTKSISYSVSKSGSAGSSAVVFSVYAPNGTVFANQSGQLILDTTAYYGSTKITSGATYQWQKYSSGGWSNISGATNSTYTVNGSDVVNIASYRCTMTYQSKQYVDVITLEDKSDTYLSEMLTIGGTTFKNGQGGSGVYVKIRSNGKEIDPLGGYIGTSYPDTKSINDYFYLVDNLNKRIVQSKWNGSSWATTTIPQTKTYTWSLMDKDGNSQTFNNGDTIRTGKAIYLSCDDINSIGTLQCEVTNS